MPETPDFEKIAARWCFNEDTDDVPEMEARRAEFVVVLKSIWNARGAADTAMIDTLYEIAPPTVKTLDRALRTLDR